MNLSTTDLAKSIAFYSVLLDAKPTKVLADYALFVTERPPLELALDLDRVVAPSHDVHYGICVETANDVEDAIARLEPVGLVDSVEREETCCYANQTKVWAKDPEGRRWEIYAVHEDTQERDDADMACCSSKTPDAVG